MACAKENNAQRAEMGKAALQGEGTFKYVVRSPIVVAFYPGDPTDTDHRQLADLHMQNNNKVSRPCCSMNRGAELQLEH